MKYFAPILFSILFLTWILNCLYIVFFTRYEDSFYLFGAFQTSKTVSALVYAILSIFSLMFVIKNRTRNEGKN